MKTGTAVILSLLLFALPVWPEPSLELSDPILVRGKQVRVSVGGSEDEGSLRLDAIYRPNSQTEKKEKVGRFGTGGTLDWTPLDAGITRLVLIGPDGEEMQSRNVAVRFPSASKSGLLIFFLAGVLLFGGSSYFMRKALGEGIE